MIPLEVASPRSFGLAPLARARLRTGWTLLDKIDEGEDDLKNIQLKIGKRKYTHAEERIVYNAEGNITSVIKIRMTDFEREIPLKLLNLDTGATEIIKITKKGKLLTRKAGQSHFNAKERHNARTAKRDQAEFHMSQKDRARFLVNF